jgi:hypothetical protein
MIYAPIREKGVTLFIDTWLPAARAGPPPACPSMHGSRLVQRQPRAPEQGIRRTLQGTDDRTDRPIRRRSTTHRRLPGSHTPPDVGEVLRAADRNHASEFGEFDRPMREGRGGRERTGESEPDNGPGVTSIATCS